MEITLEHTYRWHATTENHPKRITRRGWHIPELLFRYNNRHCLKMIVINYCYVTRYYPTFQSSSLLPKHKETVCRMSLEIEPVYINSMNNHTVTYLCTGIILMYM